jgi:Ca-activated chloride channel family protein
VTQSVVVANALPAGWSDQFALGAMAACFRSASGPVTASGMLLGGQACLAVDVTKAKRSLSTLAAGPTASAGAQGGGIVDKVLGMLHLRRRAASAAAPAAEALSSAITVFCGQPAELNGEAILFDSAQAGSPPLPDEGMLTALSVHFPKHSSAPTTLDEGLALLLYLDDLVTPRAKVRLADLLRHGGRRPLNLRRLSGQRLRLVLVDPAGAWKDAAPPLEVSLAWDH